MKSCWQYFPLICVAALAVGIVTGGCTTKARARKDSQTAFLAGQNAALRQQLAAQAAGITVVGAVQNPNVAWVSGLTLAQAVATANYSGADAPKQIIITRQGESAALDAKVLLDGTVVPLEVGDVIELR